MEPTPPEWTKILLIAGIIAVITMVGLVNYMQ